MVEITHAVYLVPDTDKAIAFLQSILGFIITVDDVALSGERFLTLGPADTDSASGVQLQVVESTLQPQISGLRSKTGQVDFILSVESAEAMIEVARKAGLVVHQEPTPAPYGIAGIFEDPFGYRWDVVQRS